MKSSTPFKSLFTQRIDSDYSDGWRDGQRALLENLDMTKAQIKELRGAVQYLREKYLQFYDDEISKKEFIEECQGVLVGDVITDLLEELRLKP